MLSVAGNTLVAIAFIFIGPMPSIKFPTTAVIQVIWMDVNQRKK